MTGEGTSGLLGWPEVKARLLLEGAQFLVAALGAAAILVVGLLLARWAGRASSRLLVRLPAVDPTLAHFLSSFLRYAVLALAVLAALARFGIEPTSLAAVLGAAALAIGLALQGTLSHVAAGVMLAVFRPFRIGDSITVEGLTGTVSDINIFFTVLETADGLRVFQPNGRLWGRPLVNNSALDARRVEVTLALQDPADLARAREIVERSAAEMCADGSVKGRPQPMVCVEPAADGSVWLTVRVWVERADAVAVRSQLAEMVLSRIAESGIALGPPTRPAAPRPRP